MRCAGASAWSVITACALVILFLGGAPLGRFLAIAAVGLGALAAMAVLSPYRLARLTSFVDPWADPFDKGFQLTQALIALGRGEWWGTGLGGSVQKLFYLPEAHTDFVLAVIGEELGLVGVLLVLALFTVIAWRSLLVAHRAEAAGRPFAALLVYGLGTLRRQLPGGQLHGRRPHPAGGSGAALSLPLRRSSPPWRWPNACGTRGWK